MKNFIKINNTRRKILKSAAISTTILASGGISAALAAETPPNKANRSALPCCNITLLRYQTSQDQVIGVANFTNRSVTLTKFSATGLSKQQGSLNVLVDLPNAPITLAPNTKVSLPIKVSTANAGWNLDEIAIPNLIAGQIHIESDHPAFSGAIPVIVFDAIPA